MIVLEAQGASLVSESIGSHFTQHRLTTLCNVSPLDGSTSRPEQEVGRKLRDLAAVLNTFFNGTPEVNADKNPRHAVLVGWLGKAGVRTKHRGRIRAPIPVGSVKLQASNAM